MENKRGPVMNALMTTQQQAEARSFLKFLHPR